MKEFTIFKSSENLKEEKKIIPRRIIAKLPMPLSSGSSRPRDQTHNSHVSCTGRQVLYLERHLGSPRVKLKILKVAREQKTDYFQRATVKLKYKIHKNGGKQRQ